MAMNYEVNKFKHEPSYNKLSSGLYVNPHYAKNVNLRNGDGLADMLTTGINFFKDHGQMIGDVANISSNIAKTVQTIKNIKNDDEKLFELKRIKHEIQNKENGSPKITKAQQEILDKIRKTGNGSETTFSRKTQACYGKGIKII